MDVFEANLKLVQSYQSFSESFVHPRSDQIQRLKEQAGPFRWPEARLAVNPVFASGGTIGDLVDLGVLHRECRRIFRRRREGADPAPLELYAHQRRASSWSSRATVSR